MRGYRQLTDRELREENDSLYGGHESRDMRQRYSSSCCSCSSSSITFLRALSGLCLLACLGAGKLVTLKVMVNLAERYRFLAAVLMLIAFAIFSGISFLFRSRNSKFYLNAEDVMSISLWKLLTVAILDNTRLFLIVISAGMIPAPMTVTLLQAVIPISIIISLLWQKELETKWLQILGSFIITIGILLHLSVYLIPLINSSSSGLTAGEKIEFWSCLLYTAASLPSVLSGRFKRWMFRQQCVDMHLFNLKVSLLQLLIAVVFSFMLLPLQWLWLSSSFSPAVAAAQERVSVNILHGTSCFFSAKNNGDTFISPEEPGYANCNLSAAPLALLIYFILTCAFGLHLPNVAASLKAKEASTNSRDFESILPRGRRRRNNIQRKKSILNGECAVRVASVLSAIVAISIFSFAPWPFSEELSDVGKEKWQDIVAVVVVILGMILYNFPKKLGSTFFTEPAFKDTDASET
eukprot:g1568.t1